MRECPEWLLGRVHRLKLAAKEARERAEEASTTLQRLWKQVDDANAHLERATVPGGEQRQEVGERVAKRQKELTEQIEALEPQLEQQKEVSARATDFDVAVTAVYERCQNWLDSGIHGPGSEFEKVDIVFPQIGLIDRLKEVEAEIASLAEEGERINAAPTAKVDLENAVREYLAELRKNCEPTVTVENGHVDIALARTGKKVELAYFPGRRVTPEALMTLMLWLDGDAFEQKILAITDRIPTSKDAIPLAAKRQRLDEIESKRSAAMYETGTLVRECIERGTPVAISKALDAEHLLGVRVRPSATVHPFVTGKGKATLPAMATA